MIEGLDHVQDLIFGVPGVLHDIDELYRSVVTEEKIIQCFASEDVFKAREESGRKFVGCRMLREILPVVKLRSAFRNEAGHVEVLRPVPLFVRGLIFGYQPAVDQRVAAFVYAIGIRIDKVCQLVHDGLRSRFCLVKDTVTENSDLVFPAEELTCRTCQCHRFEKKIFQFRKEILLIFSIQMIGDHREQIDHKTSVLEQFRIVRHNVGILQKQVVSSTKIFLRKTEAHCKCFCLRFRRLILQDTVRRVGNV